MRYVVATIVAGLMIGAAAVFVRHTERALHDHLRPGVNFDQAADRVPTGDFEAQLPAALQMQIALADVLTRFRFVLMPAVLLACFGAALLLGRWRS